MRVEKLEKEIENIVKSLLKAFEERRLLNEEKKKRDMRTKSRKHWNLELENLKSQKKEVASDRPEKTLFDFL